SPPHSGPRPAFLGLHTLLRRLSGARSLPRLDLGVRLRGWCGDLGHPVSPFVSLVCYRPTSRISPAPHGHAHDADPARWTPNRKPPPPSPPLADLPCAAAIPKPICAAR